MSIANENAKRLMDKWNVLEKELDAILDEKIDNDIMNHLEEHYNRCYKVGCMMFDAKCGEPRSISMECCEAMRQDNVRTGIEWCCIAREAGIDVVVDMLWGYVIFKDEATDKIMENGKKRYMTFEYADDDIDEE